LQEIKDIKNGIISINKKLNEYSLMTVPIAKIFKEKDEYIVINAAQSRAKFMQSTYQIYVFGKKNVDYKCFKTPIAAYNYIKKLST